MEQLCVNLSRAVILITIAVIGVFTAAAGRMLGDVGRAGMLLLAYGLGHCSVIVLAGTFTELVQRFLNWNEQSRGVVIVQRISGARVVRGGVWLLYSAP